MTKLLGDRIRSWFAGHESSGSVEVARQPAQKPVHAEPAAPIDHTSRGFQEMIQSLPAREGLAILDLGEINQANVRFVTGLGHRHYSEDLLASLDQTFGSAPQQAAGGEESLWDEATLDNFLDSVLNFPGGQFDAVLIWEVLQLVPPPLVPALMDRLFAVTRPGGILFAVFYGGPRRPAIAVNSYRMMDQRTLRVTPKEMRVPAQFFNNRTIEELFAGCRSTKFFLTRDSLREVIVRR